jgi:cytochrome P450
VLSESTIISYLGSPAFDEDPFPAYRFFLDHPGWPSPSGYRVFARFDDVLGILRDPDSFGQPGRVDGNFHTVDPPEHTRLRKLVSRAEREGPSRVRSRYPSLPRRGTRA